MSELEIRRVWELMGHDCSDLDDDQLLRAAELLVERFGTLSPIEQERPLSTAAPIVEGVLAEIRAEVLPFAAMPAAPPPTKPPLLKPHGPTYKQLGWRSIFSPLRPAPDPVELLTFEGDHPVDDTAKWREARERFDRSRSGYLYALLRAAETPEGREGVPEVAERVIAERDRKRAARRRM